ncbi:vgr related protein [Sphingomonas sp. MMS24-J13]|uniref:vgr related protein n=1 Tax=Sphingomonas sp. MMS24-J13 TaxID=3238686 RepID=UPI00384ADAA2
MMFGRALDAGQVRIHSAKWWPFQPRRTVMAPDGDIWFAPGDGLWREDFATAPPALQQLLVHELTHCWQHQSGICLPLRRHPFCRYDYRIAPERPLHRYGIEQQAMIVEHAFAARQARRHDPVLEALLIEVGLGSPSS